MSCDKMISTLPPVPDSVRTVASTLCETGRMTMKDLQRDSGLARRTVYGALQRLRDLGYLREFPNLRDARQTWFILREEN